MSPYEEAIDPAPVYRGPSPSAAPPSFSDPVTGYCGHSAASEHRPANVLRIIGGNVHGVPPSQRCIPRRSCPGFCKDCFLVAKTLDLQAQVCCWNEVNVNWSSIEDTSRPYARYPQWFSACHIRTSHLPGPYDCYQRFGGTMLWALDSAVHRLDSSRSGADSLGRWSWCFLRGRSNKSVTVVSAYRPIKNLQSPGSVYSQQAAHLLSLGDSTDPIKKFDSDLAALVSQFIQHGSSVVLLIDANTPIHRRNNAFSSLMRRSGLHSALLHSHPHAFPSRRDGTEVIDGIFVTPDLLGLACGYAGWLSDHCTLFIDLPMQLVFGHSLPPIVTLQARRLQLQDPRVVQKFLSLLKKEMTARNLFDRASSLSIQAMELHAAAGNDPSFAPDTSFAARYDKVDSDFTQCLQLAEAGCRQFHTGTVPWTPQYSFMMDHLHLLQGLLRLRHRQSRSPGARLNWSHYRRVAKALDMLDVFGFSISQLKREITTVTSSISQYRKTAAQQRVTFLDSLAAAKADQTTLPFVTVRKQLAVVEEQRRQARVIKSAMTPHLRRGAVSMVEVTLPEGSTQLTSQQPIEQAIFQENLSKFFQASDTPFLSEPLFSQYCPLGSSRPTSVHSNLSSLSPGTQSLLAHFSSPPPTDFTLPPSYADFVSSWSRQKERTSSYPSRHFGHIKASMLCPQASRIAYHLETIPLLTGLAPSSWKQAVDVMIEKQPGVFLLKKLRTIVLFDCLCNHAFKWIGKEMMRVAELHHLLAPEQHGSRNGRRANWAALEQRLTCDLSRQTLQPAAIIFNDAVGCYDRIVHSVASLCMQQVGTPSSVTNCMFRCLQDMRHQVRTVFGDSAAFYQAADWHIDDDPLIALPISGVGQGNGAGPQIWAVISTPIANSLRQQDLGFLFRAALSDSPVSYVGFIFVDDATIGFSRPGWSRERVVSHAQQALSLWEDTLRATGGAVSPEKTFWYLLDYAWSSDGESWKYVTKGQFPADLQVPNSSRQLQPIDRLDPSEARRTLGVYLAPDHNEKEQLRVLRQKSVDWASRLYLSGLKDSLAWRAFQSTISKSLEFSLPVTCLSKADLHRAWTPAITATLQRMGIGKDFPLAVRYGPLSHQGLGLDHPFHRQIVSHLECLLTSSCQPDLNMSRLLRASCEYFLLELGFPGALFSAPPALWSPSITTSWVKSTWEMCFDFSITIDTDLAFPPLRRLQDCYLMSLFADLGYSPQDLAVLNRCRMFLQVITLSDLVTADGLFVTSAGMAVQYDPLFARSDLQWPRRPRPSQKSRLLWTQAVSRLCSGRSSRLVSPLGEWLPHSLLRHQFFYSPSEDRVFSRHDDSFVVYRRSAPGGNWFIPTTAIVSSPPLDFVCATGWVVGARFSLSCQSHVLRSHHICPASAAPLMFPVWAERTVQWPIDGGRHIADCLQSGSAKLVSDGSYDPISRQCVASFTLCGTDHSLRIVGSLPSPGPLDIQDSYRSELTGIYGGLLAVWRLLEKFPIATGFLTVACDGKSALAQSIAYSHCHPFPFASHSDAISAIRNLARSLPLKLSPVHVKGHQRERGGHAGSVLVGPLDELATLNDLMDEAANTFRHTFPFESLPITATFPSSLWTIRIAGNPLVHQHRPKLLHHMGIPDLLNYWSNSRAKFGSLSSNAIDWKATHSCMTSLPLKRRLHAIKIATTFVPVRRRQHLRQLAVDDHCPRCSSESLPGVTESVTHLLSCPSRSSQDRWSHSLSMLQEWLESQFTDPTLTDMLLYGLRSWVSTSSSSTLPSVYPDLWQTQQAVGWQSLLEGRIVTGWAEAQERFYRSRDFPPSRHGFRWLTLLLRKLLDIAWDQWEHRNGILHHQTEGIRLRELQHQVRSEFQLGTSRSPAIRRLFSAGLDAILRRRAFQLEQWLELVRAYRLQPHPDTSLQAQQAFMRTFLSQP